MGVLPLRAPYDFADSIRFWRRSTAELTEQWSDGVYRRLLPLNGRASLLVVRSVGSLDAPAVSVALDGEELSGARLQAHAPVVRRLLNDDLDTAAATSVLAQVPLLRPLLECYPGLRPPRALSLWEALVWAICAQQIGLAFALVIKERLVRRFSETREIAGQPLSAFPTPAALAAADPAELRSMQLSGSKASYIIGLAQAIEEGRLDPAAVEAMPSDEAATYLMRFRGIGRWTAEYALLRGLGRADALPAVDAGVRNALVGLGALPPRPAEAEIRAWAEQVYPWGGVLALYLWRWLSDA